MLNSESQTRPTYYASDSNIGCNVEDCKRFQACMSTGEKKHPLITPPSCDNIMNRVLTFMMMTLLVASAFPLNATADASDDIPTNACGNTGVLHTVHFSNSSCTRHTLIWCIKLCQHDIGRHRTVHLLVCIIRTNRPSL